MSVEIDCALRKHGFRRRKPQVRTHDRMRRTPCLSEYVTSSWGVGAREKGDGQAAI
ncbi:hypothetical protein PXH69_33930 [Rhodococcus qingshengii]|uniref:Transposase n=1 Tax=Rhodococcus qingshengii TaxID=334542 RepID=A0AAW6LWY4_RHOSG|nr:hypothetical protein [Rhodococcus qingshengii]MDE8649966.1 hypothetical protein [Rhodococcus qingshengii]